MKEMCNRIDGETFDISRVIKQTISDLGIDADPRRFTLQADVLLATVIEACRAGGVASYVQVAADVTKALDHFAESCDMSQEESERFHMMRVALYKGIIAARPKEMQPATNADEESESPMDAVFAWRRTMAELIGDANNRDARTVLDYGSGEKGIGRAVLEDTLRHEHDHLILWEPNSKVRPGKDPRIDVAETWEDAAKNARRVDIVHLSFVLCQFSHDQSRQTLHMLRGAFPNATLTVIDYVLRGRDDAARLLNSQNEQKWKEVLGLKPFMETRTQFDEETLTGLIREAGWEDVEFTNLGAGRGMFVGFREADVFDRASDDETDAAATRRNSQSSPARRSPS